MISKIKKISNLRFSISLIILAALTASSAVVLHDDFLPFFKWCIAAILLGAAAWPLSARLFSGFRDRGWMFSKIIGLAIPGFIVWVLTCFNITKFTASTSIFVVIIFAAVCWGWYFLFDRKKEHSGTEIMPDLIVMEEVIFMAAFLMWTYLSGCRPEALSTEKFMDFGFMQAMMRDSNLPAIDMWYAGKTINYYYGGQYFAVFLTKLTFTKVTVTYNIARSLVGAFAFMLPFTIVHQVFVMKDGSEYKGDVLPSVTGALAGAAVSLAGNMHYVLYGMFGSVFKLSGYESYWFPSSTRYIGHNPDVATDKTIHEFPSYSLVLGDLHAHMVNLIFVLALLGIIFAWFMKLKKEESAAAGEKTNIIDIIKSAVLDPYVWLIGFFIGMFQWTNYWDFVIYLTVALISSALWAIRSIRRGLSGALMQLLIRAVIFVGFAEIVAIPFNMSFETMVSGVALCTAHSALYQLIILWGLPAAAVVMLVIFTIVETSRRQLIAGEGEEAGIKPGPVRAYISKLTIADMFMVMLGICAIGLIIIPEIVYVRDIYENAYARSNTMFKLTYQAYIMFGMTMIYAIFRVLSSAAAVIAKAVTIVILGLFVLTLGYFPYSVKCWFGEVTDLSTYRTLDATAYLINEIPNDYEAIMWLMENVEGNPVVLEANGDSYTEYNRVSAMTGLPTVVGWATHEWLWRDNLSEQYARADDVELIYTSTDPEQVRELIEKYDIEYIFVGTYEREKYEYLNEGLLWNLGEIVFTGTYGDNPAYIIKVSR